MSTIGYIMAKRMKYFLCVATRGRIKDTDCHPKDYWNKSNK